jgi:hypothetical protein
VLPWLHGRIQRAFWIRGDTEANPDPTEKLERKNATNQDKRGRRERLFDLLLAVVNDQNGVIAFNSLDLRIKHHLQMRLFPRLIQAYGISMATVSSCLYGFLVRVPQLHPESPGQLQVVEPNLGRFLYTVSEFELLLVGQILSLTHGLFGKGPVSCELFRPRVEQLSIVSIVAARAPVGKLTQTLHGLANIVTISTRQPSMVRIRSTLKRLGSPFHGKLLRFMTDAAFVGKWTISPVLLTMARMARQRRMKPIQFEGRISVVREPQVFTAPSRLYMTSSTGSTHLAGVRIGVT